jgi:hypothetical protein
LTVVWNASRLQFEASVGHREKQKRRIKESEESENVRPQFGNAPRQRGRDDSVHGRQWRRNPGLASPQSESHAAHSQAGVPPSLSPNPGGDDAGDDTNRGPEQPKTIHELSWPRLAVQSETLSIDVLRILHGWIQHQTLDSGDAGVIQHIRPCASGIVAGIPQLVFGLQRCAC